jgi:catechol 2,3-dioxygenase-like lactoylglutathione lyase family enzyme
MLRHTGLVVRDMEKAISFYGDNFKLKVARDMVESGTYISKMLSLEDVKVRTVKMLDERENCLELLNFLNISSPYAASLISDVGCSHIAFTVEDVDELYSKFSELGFFLVSEPVVPPGGQVKVFFCQVPRQLGGVFLEIVEETK